MTIRQSLERRCQRTVGGTVAFLLVAGWLVSSGPRVFVLRFVFAVLMGAVVFAAAWSLFEIPCPRCRKRLGVVGFCVASGLMANRSPRCRHCQVALDQDIPTAPPAKEA
jgi:hypothetical protein